MMTVNRQGIRIEQCEGCRGVFLDRGELEQVIDGEQRHYGSMEPSHGGYYADSPPPYRGRRYPDSPPPFGGRRRKRGFLSELFD